MGKSIGYFGPVAPTATDRFTITLGELPDVTTYGPYPYDLAMTLARAAFDANDGWGRRVSVTHIPR